MQFVIKQQMLEHFGRNAYYRYETQRTAYHSFRTKIHPAVIPQKRDNG